MIEIPEDVWSAARRDTSRIVDGFRVPIRQAIFLPIYFGILIATLSSALDRMPEDFGGYVPVAGQLPDLFRIRNAVIIPSEPSDRPTYQGAQ